jgi:hypothetical protein
MITPIEDPQVGGAAALAARLLASEARKNMALRRAVEAYRRCSDARASELPIGGCNVRHRMRRRSIWQHLCLSV